MDNAADFGSDKRTAATLQPLSATEVAELYEQQTPRVTAFLMGVLRDRELVAEAVQNTFRRVLEAGHTARRESLPGWLLTVAYHEAMALRRRTAIDGRARQRYQAARHERTEDTEESPQEAQLISREDVERVRAALVELPAEQRWVVERRMYHDETFAVIAANLNVPLGTVLTRMRLAMQKLGRRMNAE